MHSWAICKLSSTGITHACIRAFGVDSFPLMLVSLWFRLTVVLWRLQWAFHPADIPVAVELIAVLGKYSYCFESKTFVQCCRNWIGRHVPGDDAMNVFS